MRYLRLFEDNSGSKLELIKNIIKENQFLSKYADQITEDSLKEFNEYIYVKLPDELNSPHINKHFDKSNPGSIWSISKEEVTKLILETLAKKPTKSLQEGPTFKYKWLNLEYTKPVGFDSLKKVDGDISKEVDLEPFGMVERVKEWEKVDAVVRRKCLIHECGLFLVWSRRWKLPSWRGVASKKLFSNTLPKSVRRYCAVGKCFAS